MASPISMGTMGSWTGQHHQIQHDRPQSSFSQEQPMLSEKPQDDDAPQLRLMGLKISYTVDREAQVNYLARYPQALQVQVVPLDERSSIGIADLRVCAQCIADCSPEILGQETDYTVYAYDFSESDHPLVGQGMLSWILEGDAPQSSMVVGRVTKNMLAAFNGGLRETLEVKLKLTPSARILRPEPRPAYQQTESQLDMGMSRPASQSQVGQQLQDCIMTPTGVAEWNAFVQSNLQLGQAAASSRINSPAPAPQQSRLSLAHSRTNSLTSAPPSQNAQQLPPPQHQQLPPPQHQQLPPPQHQQPDHTQQQTTQQQHEGPNRVAPVPVEPPTDGINPPSRPSSRTSTRSRKRPTGRPRGRPKKKQPPIEAQGSTSGYEEGTDVEEGPAKKKRATTVQASKKINTPFGSGPELLRVAASTSGSIRAMRPAGQTPDPALPGSHLQEVPRAPTPVPDGDPRQGRGGARAANGSSLRRQSTLSQATAVRESSQPSFCEMTFEMSPPSQDGRSPGDSEVATPLYSDGSPAPIGSSPPVPRTRPFMRSSPPASSPILPPMHKPQPDSGFMSGGVDENMEESIKPLELPPADGPSLSKKRSRSTAKVPVRVFTMQLEEVPSRADGTYQLPQKPAVTNGSTSVDSRTPAAEMANMGDMTNAADAPKNVVLDVTGGTVEAGKALSPQPGEQAVAIDTNADACSTTAPNGVTTATVDHASTRPMLDLEITLEEELLAALQVVTDTEAEYPGLTTEGNSPSVIFDAPSFPITRSEAIPTRTLALPTMPASDPVGPLALPSLPFPPDTSFSEAPYPPSEALEPPKSPKTSKNFVKKESIRQKLQQAIESGEMPPYCHNCGAIETPTWRKIWVQDNAGTPEDHVPEDYEYSEKPGRLTAVIILERDEDEKPTKYQLIKKSLDSDDEKPLWQKLLLCNPCGIWICKWKTHRPEERWEKDQTRLQNGGRRSRKSSAPRAAAPRVIAPRVSKPRRKVQKTEPTSELNCGTDPVGPNDQMDRSRLIDIDEIKGEVRSREASFALEQALRSDFQPPSPEHRFRPSSTHSRGTGTFCSPITLDEDEETVKMGTTRRILFPSPRKDGIPKTLDDVSVNLVTMPPLQQQQNATEFNKENLPVNDDDDLEVLFRSPVARPSTPPPKDKPTNAGAFKTPTRPTPNHRPITRSISRSIRSSRSHRSAEQVASMLQRTPTRTPRSVARLLAESPSVRRSPRLAQPDTSPETPMTRSLHLLLSESNDFDIDPATLDLDLSTIVDLEDNAHEMIDFGNLLNTDGILPSSPPKRAEGAFDYVGTASMWAQWSDASQLDVDMDG